MSALTAQELALDGIFPDDILYVRYRIYFPGNISAKAQKFLQLKAVEILAFGDAYAKDRIWHSDYFNLVVAEDEGGNYCLTGKSEIGENMHEEWYFAVLLFEISKLLPDCIVK